MKCRTKISSDRDIAKTWFCTCIPNNCGRISKKGWKLCLVKAICNIMGQQRNESQVAVGRKQHEQRKFKLLITENRTLTLMLRHFTK